MHVLIKRGTYRGVTVRVTRTRYTEQPLKQETVEGRTTNQSARHESLEARRENGEGNKNLLRRYFTLPSL